MRILNINTELTNESVNIPYRMHKQFLNQGHDSYFLTADTSVAAQNVISTKTAFAHQKIALSRFIRKIIFGKLLGFNKYFFYPEWNIHGTTAEKILSPVPIKPEIIVAYWVDYYFTQKVIYELSQITGAPVLWYFMDMAPLTGGCHMAYDCKRYETGCCKCPALRFNWKYDISFRSYMNKKKYIEKTYLATISASTYLYNQINKCKLYENKPNYKIMLPVEENIYKPGNKNSVKKAFGLPEESKIIFFGAASINVENKGMKYLIEALKILDKKLESDPVLKEKIFVLIAGKGNLNLNIPFRYKNVGYLDTQEKLAQTYQGADMYVCPTIQDSGPIMINEAVMSGTPVVSFDMGVAYDLVHTGQTGYRAKLRDSWDLANGMNYILKLNDQEWHAMSRRCRDLALKCCASCQQIKKVIEIAKSMAKNSNIKG